MIFVVLYFTVPNAFGHFFKLIIIIYNKTARRENYKYTFGKRSIENSPRKIERFIATKLPFVIAIPNAFPFNTNTATVVYIFPVMWTRACLNPAVIAFYLIYIHIHTPMYALHSCVLMNAMTFPPYPCR